MKEFFWTAGQLGWGSFALLVFTSLWWLLGDLIWRLTSVRIRRLAMMMSVGWIACVLLVLLGFYLSSR